MRNILSIIIICSFVTMSAYADMTQYNKSFGQTDYDEMTSSRAVMNYQGYTSPIYEPFSSTIPSEETEVGASHKGRQPLRFPKPGETGQSDESPIGDAVLPLLALVLAFGAVIYFRRKRIAK